VIVLEDIDVKERRLRTLLRSLETVVVAFSGGVDSALVLKIAGDELGENAFGVTGRSESLAGTELEGANAFAAEIGARHEVLDTHELLDPNYAANPANRCYFCKKELYGKLRELDDEGDWRPGRKAAREFGVRSPLAEAGFRKTDVRSLARKLGLEVWDKPALACLSSRFPYGTPITLELLRQVDAAETAVKAAGVRVCRVRHHGEVARIEVPADDVARLAEPGIRERIAAGVKAAGYRYVALDLGGYVPGNLNAALDG
jgi:uncharacterized protein